MGIFDLKHWVVVLVVVVLVFGTTKLKNAGTDVGESIKGFRKAISDDEKLAAPVAPPMVEPQPHTTSLLNEQHAIEMRAQKAGEPTREDV